MAVCSTLLRLPISVFNKQYAQRTTSSARPLNENLETLLKFVGRYLEKKSAMNE